MKLILLPLVVLLNSFMIQAQPDSASLLNEARTKLGDRSASVSSILTDKKYIGIHPHTPFRELIRSNASSAILKIATADEPGKKIRVLGTITGKDGDPVSGALVYLYQTDAKGWYSATSPHVGGNEGDMRHARIFGYVKTDANGQFELHTVKPSGYPSSDLPAHIHVHVEADGYRNFVNEFLFDDDDRLVGNIREQSVRNRFIISKPGNAVAGFDQQFSYKIELLRIK